ncbi:hypothetical protein GGR95_001396 [Sulfitobacter undariae]|uniref:Uncharacterized protein n=1 Tax=Sulfitobacter undariae TaxID=1563671 RepID=A0A7W6E836_9RHOB|nr:hypothetical protein [Sulfitobacter undariae]MBB3993765.1 hypothetical protein [Sulfitobacter undariae]
MPPTPPQKRITLKSVVSCRNEQIKLYREARNGKLKIEDASRLVHILMLVAKSFEATDLQERIEALESMTQ